MKQLHKTIFFLFVLSLSVSAQVKTTRSDRLPPNAPVPKSVNKWDGVRTTTAQVVQEETGELSSSNIIQDRKMSEFEQGGHFDCRGFVLPGTKRGGVCDWNMIRDFIWQHWQDKKQAYIRFTGDSVDAVSTSHIFIEPDETGVWHLAWRIARHHAIPQLNNKIDDILDLASIERIENKGNKDWEIRIINKAGRVVYTIPGLD